MRISPDFFGKRSGKRSTIFWYVQFWISGRVVALMENFRTPRCWAVAQLSRFPALPLAMWISLWMVTSLKRIFAVIVPIKGKGCRDP